MFVAVFIICLMSNSKNICTANIGRDTPFYTKKECELSTQATYASRDFRCIKVGQSESLSASNSKSK